MIERVNPAETVDCTLDIAILKKREPKAEYQEEAKYQARSGVGTDFRQTGEETEAKYQANDEAKHQADDNKIPSLWYQAKAEAKYQADGDRNDGPWYQAKTEARYKDEAKYHARTGVGTNLCQAGEETEAKYQADEEAKHQADDNKNPGLRYQAKTETKHQADGDRNDCPLYQDKTEADEKPLLQLKNEMTKVALVRVARHRNKVQDLRLTDKHRPGKARPCDNASCHAAPIKDIDKEERERLMGDTGGDIQVTRVFIADMPCRWRS